MDARARTAARRAPEEAAAGRAAQTLVLEPGRADAAYWRDLWRYRELFAVLAWRDIAVRYKQSVIGVAWALIRPFLTMVVFTVIFGRLAGLPTEGDVPYPVMVFAGMLPWFLFSTILADASQSLVSNALMIRKVYYPRIITPAAASIVALVDFGISLLLLFVLMAVYGVAPGWQILLLPVFLAYGLAAALGPALVFAALGVAFRDVRFIVPFVIQFGLYVSPVGFSSDVVPERWLWLYGLNPMVSVIDGFRWCLLGGQSSPDPVSAVLGALVVALMLWLGIRTFRRGERSFADVV